MALKVRCFLARVVNMNFPNSENVNTSIDLKFCDRLPSIHGNSPAVTNSSTAQVDDQLGCISIQSFQD